MKINRKAFTLIELLVVIAIIALLLAILMPSLKKAKQIAQQVVCKSNCKTLGLANALYANEYNGCFVANNDRTVPTINGRYRIWCTNQTFMDYLAMSGDDVALSVPGNNFVLPEKYRCPSAKLRDADDPTWGPYVVRISYAMNGYSQDNFFESDPAQIWRSTKIRNSSGKIIFIDGSDIVATVRGANYKTKWDRYGDTYRHPDNFDGAIEMTSYRHSEKANITFADGHADSMKKEDIFTFDDNGTPNENDDTPNDVANDQLWLVHRL
jgi:prepilin-type N-terminal cleavage/methylation domain-containing protein/prepilin-type processing-associated H-X9-DG protein